MPDVVALYLLVVDEINGDVQYNLVPTVRLTDLAGLKLAVWSCANCSIFF